MPETRYEIEHSYPKKMLAKDKIVVNAKIKRIPYEVSDEQLAEDRADAEMDKLREALKQGKHIKVE